jgi:hypothetical protein
LSVARLTAPVAFLRRSAPVALLLVGVLLLAGAVAGIARIDAPLRAAVVDGPAHGTFEDVSEHRGPPVWREDRVQPSVAPGSDGC